MSEAVPVAAPVPEALGVEVDHLPNHGLQAGADLREALGIQHVLDNDVAVAVEQRRGTLRKAGLRGVHHELILLRRAHAHQRV